MATKAPAAPRSEVVASQRDLLLATKLHVPGPRPGLVARPRLAERLDEGLGHGVVVVVAPAGYGKTVLLAEWTRSGACPAGWLSLDAGDNDPRRFWRHALVALEPLSPAISERVGPLAGSPAPPTFEPLVTALINDLVGDSAADEGLLVLDDYHLIRSDVVHESFGFLLEHRPPQLRVVLASRSDPPLSLARLRARGQLAEVRAADLRFTIGEAGALLQVLMASPGRALSDDVVAALAARTEGWAAGLQLAALSLRGQSDVAGYVAAFTGSQRYVLDYLAEEVLEGQDEPLRTFLVETSVLERLSGPLCDAMTGRVDSQALLEQADRAGLFLVSLDEVRGWWRYHHLFADLLRARLDRHPDWGARLHRAAAAWHDEHGLPDDAIHHALAAGEMVWAARLIEEHFDTLFYLNGEPVAINRWLQALPDDLVRSRPRLLLAQSVMAAMRGDVETMEPLIAAAEQASVGAIVEPFTPTASRAGSLLVNVPALIALNRSYAAQLRGDAEGTAVYTSRALAQVREGEDTLSVSIEGFLGMAQWLRGHLPEAELAFASRIAGLRNASQATMTAWMEYSLARIQRARGRLDASIQTCQQALEFVATAGQPDPPTAGPALVGLAEVAYQRNDLHAALGYVTEGIGLCRQFVYTPTLVAGLTTLAWIREASGDPVGALNAMREAEDYAVGPAGLLNPVPAQRARLQLAQGDLMGPSDWTRSCGLDPDDDPHYPLEPGHLVLARLLLAQGLFDRAIALLDRLHAAAAAQERAGSLIEVQALRALALRAAGDESGALTALAGALGLACPQGYVRVFADEGPPMADLLSRLIAIQRDNEAAASVPLDCLARLQRALAAHSGSDHGRSPQELPGLVDHLTKRELEVLAMLAAGMSNQAVATQLVVSLDTVKKHVSHVLTKLGAVNRTEAVARARELGLIT